MIVARQVLQLIQRYEFPFRSFASQEPEFRRIPREPNVDPLVIQMADVASDNIDDFVDWFALLFIVGSIAPESFDSGTELLAYAHTHLRRTINKAVEFVEFQAVAAQSNDFADKIDMAATEMATQIRKRDWSTIRDYPKLWRGSLSAR